MNKDLQNIKIAYHRNGIAGNGFHVVLFDEIQDGGIYSMMAVVFREFGHCAVFDRDLLCTGTIDFMANSFSGVEYAEALRDAIEHYDQN